MFLTFVEKKGGWREGGGGGVGLVLFTLALSVSDDKWVDLSISAVTFIKEIWPSSRESSTAL